GWGFADVLPFFKKSEGNRRLKIGSDYHGTDGPLIVSDIARPNPASLAFLDAAKEAGYDRSTDFNDQEQVGGAALFQVTINEDGTRCSAATAFLPRMTSEARERLTIAPNIEVTRIVVHDKQAVGVEILTGEGTKRTIKARRE